jgi:hypothetical protein
MRNLPHTPMMTARRLTLAVAITLVTALLIFAGYVWMALNFSYSEGERAGYLQKFSKRGWICKTWEGEIQLISMPGAIAEKFTFTVRDPAVAKQLSGAIGRRVLMSYTQHKGVPGSCFGETEYFVEQMQES